MLPTLSQHSSSGNVLLDLLPEADWLQLMPHLVAMKHTVKDVLYEPTRPIDHLYFPIGAIMSALTVMSDGSAIEVATVGREGIVGHTAINSNRVSAHRVIVQVADGSLRIGVRAFEKAMSSSKAIHELTGKYNTAFMMQVSQSVACNGLHQLEKRCCRWLLMTRDRLNSNEVPLTHEFLGLMLGVRRASVTDVLAPLQSEGLLHFQRGLITLLDLAAIEARSCECYRLVKEQYDRLLCP